MGGIYKIVPDEEDHDAAKADTSYAAANDVERYRLAQAAKLIRHQPLYGREAWCSPKRT